MLQLLLMKTLNYLQLIHRYIPAQTIYDIYYPHVTLVTSKALAVAQHLGLTSEQKRFIEEAAMLHDIGMIYTNRPDLGCHGQLPYLAHAPEGRRLLDSLGYPKHALAAERHNGAGITKEEIIKNNLPLPHRDMCPITIEEQIIAYADNFYTKTELTPRTLEQIKDNLLQFGQEKVDIFQNWHEKFNPSP